MVRKLNLSSYFKLNFNHNKYVIKTYEELFQAFDLTQKLPIDTILEFKNIHDFYQEQYYYSKISFYTEDDDSCITLDDSKCIVLNKINSCEINYDYEEHSLIFRMTYKPLEMKITIKCYLLDSLLIETEDDKAKDAESNIDIELLNKINILIHNDKYTWSAKAIKVHELVLRQTDGLEKYSNDRKSKFDNRLKEVAQINIQQSVLRLEPEFETFSEECNCYMNAEWLDEWTQKNRKFLSTAITEIINYKKVSFNAKGLMIFIIFHLYCTKHDNVFSSELLGYFAKNQFNWNEAALTELHKIGWITEDRIRDHQACSEFCNEYGYHICTDYYYYPSDNFFDKCGVSYIGSLLIN